MITTQPQSVLKLFLIYCPKIEIINYVRMQLQKLFHRIVPWLDQNHKKVIAQLYENKAIFSSKAKESFEDSFKITGYLI